jgi:hypothetical protein
MYIWYHTPKSTQIWNLIDNIGKDNLNSINNSLESIVNGLFFQKLIPDSWNKSSCYDGKLAICSKICGSKYDAFAKQFN